MKKTLQLFSIILACIVLFSSSTSAITLYFIGDSTMADYDVNIYKGDTEMRGWGQMFRQFLVNDIKFVNAAQNGRSSKTFYIGADSLWAGVRNKITPGDYVFIQFGHNDEKDGGISGTTGIGTAPWGEYQQFLRNYVNVTRSKGGIPILVTPIVRRDFSGTSITRKGAHDLSYTADDSTLNYPRAMKAVARDLAVPLIDITTLTKTMVESYGPTDSKTIIYTNADDTHLKAMGGTLIAHLVVNELVRQNILTEYLNTSPDLVVSPTSINYGNCYISTYMNRSVSLSAIDLNPTSGLISIKSSDGFVISTTENGVYTDSIGLIYSSANLSPTNLYIRFMPTEQKEYNGQITISYPSGSNKTIEVIGNALSITGGIAASINYPLTVDATPVISGPITSLGESWSNMYVKNYSVPASGTVIWPEGVTAGVTQRNSITGDTWPNGEIDIVSTRYVQFGLKPAPETSFTVDSIGVYVGAANTNSLKYRVMASKNADFSDAITLENSISNTSNTMTTHSYKPIIQVDESEFFYLRFYPWCSGTATSKYLCLQNLTISGKVNSKVSGFENTLKHIDIAVYPNPSQGIYYLRNIDQNINNYFEVYNQAGISVKKNKITSGSEIIDITDLPNGIYILKIYNELRTQEQLLMKN